MTSIQRQPVLEPQQQIPGTPAPTNRPQNHPQHVHPRPHENKLHGHYASQGITHFSYHPTASTMQLLESVSSSSAPSDAWADASIESRRSLSIERYWSFYRPHIRSHLTKTISTPPTPASSPPFHPFRRYRPLPDPNPSPLWSSKVFAYSSSSSSAETWVVIRSLTEIRPSIHFSPFPSASWPLDIFVLPHNGIRLELYYLTHIINSFARARLSLTLGMIHDFFSWWRVFAHFLFTYFDLEDSVLLPWAYGVRNSPSPYESLAKALAIRRGVVESLASEISNACALFHAKPSGEVLPILVRAIQDFIPRLASYMKTQESQVCRLLHGEDTSRAEMERRVFSFISQGQRGLVNIVLMTRWGDGEVEALVRKQVRGVARTRLANTVRGIQEKHISLAEAAQGRFEGEPRDAEKKMRRHFT